MHVIRIQQVDAFTQQPFRGNPAGVVLDADILKEQEFPLIAREMNVSETAFITNSDDGQTDMQIRWFTPTQEVDLCGHATIAAFHALAAEGRYNIRMGEEQTFMVKTRSGNLMVDIDWHNSLPFVNFSLPIPVFTDFSNHAIQLVQSIGLDESALNPDTLLMKANNGYLYLLVENVDDLYRAEPDIPMMNKLYEQFGINAIAAATVNTTGDEDWEMRFFTPVLGVTEDPVTGSANGPMALYLVENDIYAFQNQTLSLTGKQGKSMDREGTVYVTAKTRNGRIDTLKIGGHAVTVLDGNLSLPAAK